MSRLRNGTVLLIQAYTSNSPDTAAARRLAGSSAYYNTMMSTTWVATMMSTGPVAQIASSMWPGVNVTPVMSNGATDGLYLRLKGIQVYGVSGMFTDMDDVRAHGKDERIRSKRILSWSGFHVQVYKGLVIRNKSLKPICRARHVVT